MIPSHSQVEEGQTTATNENDSNRFMEMAKNATSEPNFKLNVRREQQQVSTN